MVFNSLQTILDEHEKNCQNNVSHVYCFLETKIVVQEIQKRMNVIQNVIGTFLPQICDAERHNDFYNTREAIHSYTSKYIWIKKFLNDNTLLAPVCQINNG